MTGALLFSMQYFVTEPTNSLDKIPILCRIRMTPAGLTSSTYLHIAAPALAADRDEGSRSKFLSAHHSDEHQAFTSRGGSQGLSYSKSRSEYC